MNNILINKNKKIKWCPGCGNYAILKQVTESLLELGVKKQNIVFVSGIGCSSRFPYYINTYGFHGIHGRATSIATGIKLANPKLSVWVITGDGDSLSIGGTHFIHILKRNLNINILLFNNEIYGLTKGQYSPTSKLYFKNKYSPKNIDAPLNPLSIALASKATFISRSLDIDKKYLKQCIKRSYFHKGTSLLEIYQNCNVFNNNAFKEYTNPDNHIYLKHGEKLIFGKKKNKGLIIKNLLPKIVYLPSKYKLWTHDENNIAKANILINILDELYNYPKPFGIFYKKKRPCYETLFYKNISYK